MRKSKVFSVSFTVDDVKEIDAFVARLGSELGMKISRNQIIRKAAIAHIRFEESQRSNKPQSYKESLRTVKV